MGSDNSVLVLDENGVNLGRMSYWDAKNLATSRNLDLVLISKKDESQVFKIMDQGKWKYQQNKHKPKKHTHQTKEMNFNVRIDSHDLTIKIQHIKDFIKKGMDVKITVTMKGREKAIPSLAHEKMNTILSALSEVSTASLKTVSPSSISVLVHPGVVKPILKSV